MRQIKKIISDVLYVSRITKINNKKILTILSVLFSQLTAYTDIAIISIFSAIIANQTTNIDLINKFLIIILANKFLILPFVVLRYIFQYLQKTIIYKLEHRVNKNLKVYLLKEIFEKRNYSVADSYFYINVLSQHVAYFYSSFANFLNNLLQIFAYATYLFVADIQAIGLIGIGIVFLFYPFKILIGKSRTFMHESYIQGQISNQEVERVVDNLFLIKILKKDKYELNQFKNTLEKYFQNLYKNQKFGLINSQLPSFVTLFVLSILISTNKFGKNISLDFIGVTLRLFQSLGNLTTSINQIINSHVHIEKFYEMEQNKLIQNPNNFVFQKSNFLEFKKVDFKYFNSDGFIFEDLNLKVYKNTHTLITGPNGSGKSTLLGLIAGVYFPINGTISSFSDKFGYIGTTPLIFNSTLQENLEYGNEKSLNKNQAINLLKMLDTFKEEDQYRLDKSISNKSLSSGQMQKIAFIRALLGQAEILLLDEAMSNLDIMSKTKIFNLIADKNITIINSTHDPNDFKNVDMRLNIEVIEGNRRVHIINEKNINN